MSSAPASAARERQRRELLSLIPDGYSHRLHMLLPSLITGAICGVAVSFIAGLTWLDLVVIPAMLVITNLGEWVAHRYMLHERLPLLTEIYERHERQHHVVFQHDDMAFRSHREMWLVLVPFYAVFVILLSVAPFAAAMGYFFGVNAGMLTIVTALGYFITYEWMHLCYHLPETHPIGRLRAVHWLRSFHQRHHDPRLMKTWNFNVTVPLWDWLLGTLWSEAKARGGQKRRDDEAPRTSHAPQRS